MITLFKIIAAILDFLHIAFIKLSQLLGFSLTDKQLHFWIIGITGILFFIVVDLFFREISKFSITAISFIYTFTLLVVFVFALEIEQKITGSGVMEFKDILFGLWGFIVFFGVFLAIKIPVYLIKKHRDTKHSKTKR